MSKKIEQLKAAVDALAKEKADIEARHNAAIAALLDAEREARRNEKLTPAMRAVLVKMASGWILKSSRFNLPESYWLESNLDNRHERVRRSVFSGLRSREAVDGGKSEGTWNTRYEISEHGRSLVESESSRSQTEAVSEMVMV